MFLLERSFFASPPPEKREGFAVYPKKGVFGKILADRERERGREREREIEREREREGW